MKCEDHLSRLITDLVNQFSVRPDRTEGIFSSACVLNTPFMLPDNTPIRLYIEDDPDLGTILTDRGETSDHVFVMGGSRLAIERRLDTVRMRLGCVELEDEIALPLDGETSGSQIARFITAVQEVASISQTAKKSTNERAFNRRVEDFLESRMVEVEPYAQVSGKTQKFRVDFKVLTRAHKQLLLWTFDPTLKGATRRVRDLTFWYNDLSKGIPEWELSETGALPVKILVNDAHMNGKRSTRESIESLQEHIPGAVIPFTHANTLDPVLTA